MPFRGRLSGMPDRSITVAATLAAVLALLPPRAEAAPAGAQEFHAVIDGSQVNPPTPSTRHGIGHFTLNATETELAYEITFDNWVTNEVFSHLHIAYGGNQEAIVHDLPNGNPKKGIFVFEDPEHRKALLEGRMYVNVHTQTYLPGEIAGYIVPGTPAVPESWGRLKALYRGD